MLGFLIMISAELESDDEKSSIWDRLSLVLNSHDLHTIGYLLLICILGFGILYQARIEAKRYFAKNKLD